MSSIPYSHLAVGGVAPRLKPLPAEEQLAQLFRLADLPSHHSTDERLPFHEPNLAAAYAHAEQMIRQHSKSFFFSTQFLQPSERQGIRALYAFCRTTDDLVDQPSHDPARDLATWVHLARANTQHQPHDPVLLAWHDTRMRYRLPIGLIDELLAGVAMDLTIHRYETFSDLWLYCYRVASVVGLLSMRIIGAAPGATGYAIKLGVALQLTNILRDVGEDAQRGRIYLPLEDLHHFGLQEADILHGVYDQRFRDLMRFEVQRAQQLYAESWAGIGMLAPQGRFAVAAAARVYQGILDKLVENDYDSFSRRAYLSFGEKLGRLPKIWWDLRAFD